jgi:hypothetical protein
MTITKESFLKDVATHNLRVVKSDGVHRHLHLRAADGSSVYHFDIITWPGYLTIAGDCGSYVFWRLNDMFQFFRSDKGQINPSYWGEKVEAADRSSGLKEWDPEAFTRSVTEAYESHWEDSEETVARAECWDEVRREILCHADSEHEAMPALRDFEFQCPDGSQWSFQDYWEMGAERYTTRFLWCCHAIVWAIEQFDALQPTAEAA